MKKQYLRTILAILLLVCAVPSFAQEVSVDRIEEDGRHQIMTEGKNFNIGGVRYNICMKVYESAYSKDWCLLISSLSYISKYSARVLLKLDNDDIIDLPVNNVHVGKLTTMPSYGVTTGSITFYSPTKEADYYSSVYGLSTDDLDKIENHKIVKIRFSDGTDFRDKEFESNSLGKFLRKCHKNIQERIDNPLKEKSIYDGF